MLKEVLRDQWGFEGIVISDWGAVHNTLDAGQVALDIEMSVFRRILSGRTFEAKESWMNQ